MPTKSGLSTDAESGLSAEEIKCSNMFSSAKRDDVIQINGVNYLSLG